MPKFDVKFTVSPMQVVFTTEVESSDPNTLEDMAYDQARDALDEWLSMKTVHLFGRSPASMKVEYYEYVMEEITDADRDESDCSDTERA